jgi:hypothetical protein
MSIITLGVHPNYPVRGILRREGTDGSMIAPKRIMYSCRGRMLTMVAYHNAVEQSGNATEYSNQMFEGYNI